MGAMSDAQISALVNRMTFGDDDDHADDAPHVAAAPPSSRAPQAGLASVVAAVAEGSGCW